MMQPPNPVTLRLIFIIIVTLSLNFSIIFTFWEIRCINEQNIHFQVQYLEWSFNFRMSALSGPAINDVRYRGERIAYEISLAEIAVFYSGYNSLHVSYLSCCSWRYMRSKECDLMFLCV